MPTVKEHCLKDDLVEAIVACRFEHDPPDAILLEGIHELCVTLIKPAASKKDPWKPDGQRVSLANLGGMWLDGEALRLAVKNQLRLVQCHSSEGLRVESGLSGRLC